MFNTIVNMHTHTLYSHNRCTIAWIRPQNNNNNIRFISAVFLRSNIFVCTSHSYHSYTHTPKNARLLEFIRFIYYQAVVLLLFRVQLLLLVGFYSQKNTKTKEKHFNLIVNRISSMYSHRMLL